MRSRLNMQRYSKNEFVTGTKGIFHHKYLNSTSKRPRGGTVQTWFLGSAPGVTRSLLGGARRSGRDGARMVSGPHEPHDCPRWPPSDQADPQGRPEATLGTWRRHGPRGDPTQPQNHHPLCTLRLDRPKIDPCPSPHFPAPYRLDPSESDARRDQCAVVLTCARIP